MTFEFRTKAETLEVLAPDLVCARILLVFHVSVDEWCSDRLGVSERLERLSWAHQPLIVRSSACGEDGASQSQAGRYLSVPNVGLVGFSEAMDRVAHSYTDAGPTDSKRDRLLVQPMLADVTASGVAFTRDPSTGSPYLMVSGAEGGDTAVVTGGRDEGGTTWSHTHWMGDVEPQDQRVRALYRLATELIERCGTDALDIEFAFDTQDRLWLFQVRPLVVPEPLVDKDVLGGYLAAIYRKIAQAMSPHPLLHGVRTVFGIMPDWNPAEIIGVRPSPLALSLYRDLVTDSIWAYQRHNYGYRNLRSVPLLIHFHGLPYIDVRASFNSFIPRDTHASLAEKLVDHYVRELLAQPALHDKVEFQIVLSAYTFDLPDRLRQLARHGFSTTETESLAGCLRRLTNRIINRQTGLWQDDAQKLKVLEERRELILNSTLPLAEKIYWLLEDCKRYGTLPFAGLARAAFVAVQMLRSLVATGVLTVEDMDAFLGGLTTIGSELSRDSRILDRDEFLDRYGHLRPGTYDIRSPRYDAAPDLYGIGCTCGAEALSPRPAFALSLAAMRRIEALLTEHGLENDVVGLFDFFQSAIEGREKAKFQFTRSLSDALELLVELGSAHGFSRDDLAHADIGVIRELQTSSENPAVLLERAIADGRQRHRGTRSILLPPVIATPDEVYSFAGFKSAPNFITMHSVTAPVRTANDSGLAGAVVFISSADPGFDWIFGQGITGFVTAFGGANSHMAIRAAELGIPAVVGAGESLFQSWLQAEVLHIDCANRRVERVR
jgi:glutamine kinase